MTRLTKNSSCKIAKAHNTSLFVYFGTKDDIEYFQAIRNTGGKCGFPLVFGIDSENTITWVKDYGTLDVVQHLSNEPVIIELALAMPYEEEKKI